MNFIYSFIFWAVCFGITSIFKVSSIDMSANTITTLFVFQILFATVLFIFLIVAFFYAMSERASAITIKNQIHRYNKEVTLAEEKYDKLKDYYEKHLAENYPNMEREIFGKIAESQPKELIALFQSYPELQTSTVLTDMMKQVTNLVDSIYSKKYEIERNEERLSNIRTDPWLLVKHGI